MSDKAAKAPETNRPADQDRKPRAEEQAGPDPVAEAVGLAGGAGDPAPSGNGVALLQRDARPAGRGYRGAQAQMLLQLQRTRGNQAVAQMLREREGSSGGETPAVQRLRSQETAEEREQRERDRQARRLEPHPRSRHRATTTSDSGAASTAAAEHPNTPGSAPTASSASSPRPTSAATSNAAATPPAVHTPPTPATGASSAPLTQAASVAPTTTTARATRPTPGTSPTGGSQPVPAADTATPTPRADASPAARASQAAPRPVESPRPAEGSVAPASASPTVGTGGSAAAPAAEAVQAARQAGAEAASAGGGGEDTGAAGGSDAGAAPASDSGGGGGGGAEATGGGDSGDGGGEAAGGPSDAELEQATAGAPAGAEALSPGERDTALQDVAGDGAGGGEAEAGGGGGGGGSAIADPPAPPTPQVPQDNPAGALAAVGNLPPSQLQAALGGVQGAVNASVGQQRTQLAAAPPQMPRPTGLPAVPPGTAAGRQAPPAANGRPVQRVPEGQARPLPPPQPLPPAPRPPTERVQEPQVRGNDQGQMSEDDARRVQSSLAQMPTTDPALNVSAGPAPQVRLEGDADPRQAQQQRAEMERSAAQAQAQGQQDAAQPMGENEINPEAQPETLRAEVGGGGGEGGAGGGEAAAAGAGAGAGAGGAGAGGEDDAASIVAQQERGAEIRSAVAQGQAQMAAQRQQHAERATQERARHQQEVAQLEQQATQEQTQTRAQARGEVQQLRGEWNQEQRSLVTQSRAEAEQTTQQGQQDVQRERTQAEAQSAEHVRQGEQEAATARRQGEAEANRERQRGQQESGGVFGWLASRARAFFDGIKRGIQAAFERARSLVRAAIERAKQLATAVIERARQAIVAAIRRVGALLIAIGDRLLAGFPALRDRFRRAIQERVARAEAAVNAVANRLRDGVQRALNLLGRGLDAALGLLQRGLTAIVDGVNRAVQGAIQWARSAIAALAAFAALVRDIASNPGQWLRNLGAAIVDGIRNHLWRAFKEAVQGWFNQKVEEVLGLGRTIWQILTRGGIQLAQIGRMAWEGIKQAIPMVLVQILVEKLVSMIVPAAGAVMAIIEGLQAAWGTISRILQAIGRFVAFLRAVKTGNAGPLFAQALAAAAIAVIDFVANWLLRRLRRPAGAVAGRVRAIAQRIGQRLAAIGRRVMGGVRRAGGALRRGFQRGMGALRRGLGRIGARLGRTRFGQALRQRLQNMRNRFQQWRERRRQRREQRRADRERRKQQRLERAVAAIRPKLARLLQQGVSKLRLKATLLGWRVQHRLTSLTVSERGHVRATLNPSMDVGDGTVITDEQLGRAMLEVYREAALAAIQEIRDAGRHAPVQQSLQAGTGLPPTASRGEVIAALHDMPGSGGGRLPLIPGMVEAGVFPTHPRVLSGRVQPVGSGMFPRDPGPYSTMPGRLDEMSQEGRAGAALLATWESSREPGAALPYMFVDTMNTADPAHLTPEQQHDPAQRELARRQQQYGSLEGREVTEGKPARPHVGVQNPMAPLGAGAPQEERDEHAQKSLEFSIGVITRMVIEAARGKKAYSHNGNIPSDLTQKMEQFVRMTLGKAKAQKETYAKDMQKLRADLIRELKAFFIQFR